MVGGRMGRQGRGEERALAKKKIADSTSFEWCCTVMYVKRYFRYPGCMQRKQLLYYYYSF